MIALVVDDSAAMRRILQKALESIDWDVHTAIDGNDALAKLTELPQCDLLLTDWHMPGMDGIELIKAVRLSARFATLRIVMVTSDSVLDSVDKALEAGANDFVMKPFTADALCERVLEVMNG